MNGVYAKFLDFLEIGDDFPTVVMGVLNLSPESFYKGSVYKDLTLLEKATLEMVDGGAKMLDLGARSTAPWSKKINIKEELDRLIPSLEHVCKIVSNEIAITIDTQYREVAQQAYNVALKFKKEIIINDVSCLKTDPTLLDFVVDHDIPIILMASRNVPGDLCTIEEIIEELNKTIKLLSSKGHDDKKIIIDPGVGHWIEEKTPKHDMRIIGNLEKLQSLKKPILVAISRKSFIGATLNVPEPEKRLNGTLSATAIAIYKGAHIIRTHDVNNQLFDIIKIAEEIKRSV
jgi:dihydropteroate synthase